MHYNRPSPIHYRIARIASWFVAKLVFKRRILRNELKGKEGPFVVIANHEAALDFVNLIGISKRRMSFVISNSFYNSLPLTKFMSKMGVIPKQQFQTTIRDMKAMKSVIDNGEPLVIYPAGLMCEDGLSTPIPAATYKFLKWLNADIYAARTTGTYFAMPKWAKGLRPGRTYIDVYKLFSKEELAAADLDTIRQKTDNALLYDAYRDQEEVLVKYRNNSNIEGLEHVLYMCPHCHTEFSMQVKNGNTIHCTKCGYEQETDEYAFMHNSAGIGREYRYASDWSRVIFEKLREKLIREPEFELSSNTKIHMIDYDKHKFFEVGEGHVRLGKDHFKLTGKIKDEEVDFTIPIANIPTLPFSPGKYFELQQGSSIYRCVLVDGRLVMKYINMVKIFYDLKRTAITH
ncbi:MAG: 1-acyl-sn-glycerol-3-phosphate acyltransferase [Ruminococcaceae bacterium]|nr:1-acyl-sn-glycerol-3-phosphate acyltransferase [Oscillospiraceae bacterium]